MKLIDLTHAMTEQMPVYPGTVPPTFRVSSTVEREGFAERELCLWSHTGTHVDAPSHLLAGRPSLDQLGLERFFGLALLLPVAQFAGGEIPLSYLQEQAEAVELSQFLVLHSGWSQYWGQEQYFHGYPLLSAEAAQWLAQRPGLSGVGSDMLSLDAVDSFELPVHRIILGADKLIVENLTNLEQIQGNRFLLNALPLSFANADGSPVRAVAFQAPAGIYYPS